VCLAQIPEVEPCLPKNIAMYNGNKNISIEHFMPAFREFVDELTEDQKNCLIAAYIHNICEIKKAMMACKNVVEERECLAQIPEVVHCLE
jgi:methionine synthase I (cobalamin-dependent)